MKRHPRWVKPLGAGKVQVFFDDDPDGPVIDLAPLLTQRGVFEAARERFSAVEVAPDGRALFWRMGAGENDIVELCADALWLMVDERA